MKQLGIREIRKALLGKNYHTAHLREDDSRDFEEWRKLEHITSHMIVRIDKMEVDPFENSEEKYAYWLQFADGDAESMGYSDIEKLIEKGYIFDEHSYGINGIPTTYSFSWLDEETSNSVSIHTIYNYYVQNVMLGTMQTYEFAVKLAKKLNVMVEHIYHFIDNSNDLASMLEHFDWEHSDEYEKREEFEL